MKHIFVVHSNITYLSALGVIAAKNLSLDDILIISQYYRRAAPIVVVGLKLFSKNIFRPAFFFNFAHRTDKLISNFTGGGPFRAYVSAMTKPSKVVTTHALCVGFDFVEEGAGSYLRQYPLSSHVYDYRNGAVRWSLSWRYIKELMTSTMNLIRGESSFLHAIPFNYPSYVARDDVNFYGFHPDVFPLSPKRELISFDDIVNRFDFTNEITLPDNSYILVGEGLFSLENGYTTAQYLTLLKDKVVAWLQNRGVKQLYLKYHYNESEASQEQSLKLLRDAGLDVHLIDRDVILEMVLLRAKNATLIGYSSSLLFYGKLMGCDSYSYCEQSEIISGIEVYNELVTRIN